MSLNMDDLKKLHDAARANGVSSREFQQFQIKMYELFPSIYDIARKLTDSNTAMQAKMAALDDSLEDMQTVRKHLNDVMYFLNRGEKTEQIPTIVGDARNTLDNAISKVGAPT